MIRLKLGNIDAFEDALTAWEGLQLMIKDLSDINLLNPRIP